MSGLADEEIHVGTYVVCVIDLLGQKDKLCGWSKIPEDGKITETFRQSLKATIGAVEGFYRAFTNYFDAQREPTQLTPTILALMNGRDRQLYQRQKDVSLGFHQFSDTFVFYAPLGTTSGELNILPVYAILGACSMAMLLSLAAKLPLRGGIQIGTGIKLPELSFYGLALTEAHHLESRVAQYLRIVVARSVVEFVHHKPQSVGSEFMDKWFLDMLDLCKKMLIQDAFDKQPIVDWLGEGFRQLMGTGPQTMKALTSAHDFVGETATKYQRQFEASKSESDEKLFKRYLALYQYLLARLPDWGMEIAEPESPKT